MNIDIGGVCYKNCTWQEQGENEWVFGPLVRGIVRDKIGEFYYNKSSHDSRGGWTWFVLSRPGLAAGRGVCPSIARSIRECEARMGIKEDFPT